MALGHIITRSPCAKYSIYLRGLCALQLSGSVCGVSVYGSSSKSGIFLVAQGYTGNTR